ncbi:MAG: zinc ribbon domain-containing protein [Blautia sp.]|nr:zinc ribbon domain-containing protein [Blautia sp.]
MRCPKCDKEIADSSRFCSFCGYRIGGEKNTKNKFENKTLFLALAVGFIIVFGAVICVLLLKNSRKLPSIEDNIVYNTENNSESVNTIQENTIIGTWECNVSSSETGYSVILMGCGCSSDTLVFYEDGTFSLADGINGTYSIVHDGKTLLMTNEWGNDHYFDFELNDNELNIYNEWNNKIPFEKEIPRNSIALTSDNPIIGRWECKMEELEELNAVLIIEFCEDGILKMQITYPSETDADSMVTETETMAFELMDDGNTIILKDDNYESIETYRIEGSMLILDGEDINIAGQYEITLQKIE